MANNEVGFTIKVDGVDRTVKSLADLQQSIKDLSHEAAKADYGTKSYDEIVGRIQQAKAAVKEFKNDTRTKEVKDQFTDLAGGVSSSFDIAEGSLKSFGIESKALGAVSSSAQGLISAALNARQIAELRVDAAVALRTIAEKAAAAGTVILNTVNKALNLTLEANPIGIIVVAIGLLAVGIMKAIGPIKSFISSFTGLNSVIESTVGVLRDIGSFLTGGLIDDASTAKTRDNVDKTLKALDDISNKNNMLIDDDKRRLAVMEASGAKSKDLLAQKKKINLEEVASRQAAVDALIKLQLADGKLDDEKKQKLAELQKEIKDLNNEAAVDQAGYDKEVKDKAKEAAQAAKDHQKEMLDNIYGIMVKTKELNNKAKTDAIKNEDEKAKQILLIQQQATRDELAHAISTFDKEQAERKKKGLKVTMEETKYRESLGKEMLALQKSQGVELTNLEDEQKKARLLKERAFAKELEDLKTETGLIGITNARQRAKIELQIEIEKQIEEVNATENSVMNQDQKDKKIAALQNLNHAKAKAMDEGFKQEDLQTNMAFNESIIGDERNSFNNRLEANKSNLGLINQITFQTEAEKTAAIKANTEQRKAIEQAAFEYKVSMATAEMDVAAQAGQFLQQIAGKNKALAIAGIVIEQAAAIGKIVANTAVANAKSVATFPITAGMPWVAINTVSAGLSIASTIASAAKSIAQITAADTGSGGGGGSAPGVAAPSKFANGGLVTGPGTGTSDSIPALLSHGESVINANSTSQFGGLLSQINQAGGGAPIPSQSNNNASPVFKTYVVASDMSSQQEADKRIKDISRI